MTQVDKICMIRTAAVDQRIPRFDLQSTFSSIIAKKPAVSTVVAEKHAIFTVVVPIIH